MTEARTDWTDLPMPWAGLGRTMEAWTRSLAASQLFLEGVSRYSKDFSRSFASSTATFAGLEAARLPGRTPVENAVAYRRILEMNQELARRASLATLTLFDELAREEAELAARAWARTWLGGEGETIDGWAARQERASRTLLVDVPAAIAAVADEYGFHFERGTNPLVAETDRFLLYRIAPIEPGVTTDMAAKPVIIVPPYVLGSNILAFLPAERRSYVHAFANQGIPTYIRIMKPLAETEALQVMTGEDDVRDTRLFCEKVRETHGRPVTINGYCQGGFSALCSILSGELDGLVDALITCVSPMDGTRSAGLAGFLAGLPPEFNDLAYGTKTLPNGKRVADGHLMGWVYKLKSIESENPISAYLRDLKRFGRKGGPRAIGKSAAAINYWLINERSDLPLEITKMSFASYRTPISSEGVLPVRLFGRELRLERLAAKGIRWLVCYGEHDDLVEKETALAPLDHVRAEVTEFPRGHVAIATSWSSPDSACALHKVFGQGYRGPVRYQLDLDAQGRIA